MFDNVKILLEEAISKSGTSYVRGKVVFEDGSSVYVYDRNLLLLLSAKLVK